LGSKGRRVKELRDGGRGRSGSAGVLEMWKRKRELEERAEGETGKEEDKGEKQRNGEIAGRSSGGKRDGDDGVHKKIDG